METEHITTPKLIGRHEECKTLEDCMTSPRSEFVIVCGRRRIGKTFLVDQFFNYQYDFSFIGKRNMKTHLQLQFFARELRRCSGNKPERFANWYDAFNALEDYLDTLPKDRKKVLFFDEMPWIDTRRSTFVSALENFWNGWANRRYDIVLIASGSATSWMADKLIENKGGLHNRITRRINLSPFSLSETEEYLQAVGSTFTRYDILQCYMFTGGVPFYLSLLNPKLSVAQNIDMLFFGKNAPLRTEFNELYSALFTQVDSYIKVVETLNAHKAGMTKSEIAKAVKFNGSFLKKILDNLEQCDFIDSYAMFGKKKTTVFRLFDFYTLFYFKFIAGRNDKDPDWWSHNLDDPGLRAWMGLTFELICMRHHVQIKKALGISGVATSISTWKCEPDPENDLPGAQIDMIIERADRMIHLCEMKFSEEEYNLTNDYEMRLRTRMSVFRIKTHTKKAIVNTFVTTFGVGAGKRHSIVHSEVTMDDLFMP